MDSQVILIPFISYETDAADVWIGRYDTAIYRPVDIPRQALADFADMHDPDEILGHCESWRAVDIFVPTEQTPTRWEARNIAQVLGLDGEHD